MSTLPPLANVFAFTDPDPRVVDEVRARMTSVGDFDEVYTPAPSWVAGTKALPGQTATQRDRSFVFAQGADLVPNITERDLDRLVEMSGDFGFLHLRTNGAGTVVRACGGPVPFYVYDEGRQRAVSTRIADFVRYLPAPPRPDPLVFATWTTGWGAFPDNRSFLVGVKVLPRGHTAIVDRIARTRVERYWDPRPNHLDPPDCLPEQAAKFRQHLLAALERDLDPSGGNLLTLSGGVDSSSLSALIRGNLRYPLASLSLVPRHTPAWRANFPRVAEVVRQWDIAPAWIEMLSTADRLRLMASAPGVVFPVPHPALGALPRVTELHDIRVLVGGEFADEVCGSAFTFADWVNHTSLLTLLRTPASALPRGSRDRLRWLRKRVRVARGHPELPYADQLPDFFAPTLRDEYQEWREQQERLATVDDKPRRTFVRQVENDGWVAMNWEACSALGVRRSVPFMTREALDLAYRCHPRALIGPGTKRLLRAALEGDVPRSYLDRPKGGPPVPVDPPQASWSPPPLGEFGEIVNRGVLSSRSNTAVAALALTQLSMAIEALDRIRPTGRLAPSSREWSVHASRRKRGAHT